jgi:hypothetical protein
METKPTPGPWTIYYDGRKPYAILPAGRPGEICQFSTAYGNEANAHLIAACPQMYEALKASLPQLYHPARGNEGEDRYKCAGKDGCPACMAEAALALVEGGEK